MKQDAYQYCLYLLSRQDYSEFKLTEKLKLKQFDKAAIEEAIMRLKEKKYLREDEYKRLTARRWIQKGYSDELIKRRAEQEKLHISSQELLMWRDECNQSSSESLHQLIQKKSRGKDLQEDKVREKVLRFILSKGFSYDEAKRALRDHLQSSP
jgi:regulatory protein